MRLTLTALVAATFVALVSAQPRARTSLDLYLIDVEGGNATLLVSPAGESLLIDTANGGAAATRDADRIMAAVRDAGVTQIDHLVTTHFHTDHIGAMAELTGGCRCANSSILVRTSRPADERLRPEDRIPPLYAKATHTVVKPGDRIAMKGLDVRIPTAGGRRDQDAAAGRRPAEPVLRAVHAAGAGHHRERTVGGHTRHVRTVPAGPPGRPHGEQGVRPDVPVEPAGHHRSAGRRHTTARRSPTARCSSMRSSRASS